MDFVIFVKFFYPKKQLEIDNEDVRIDMEDVLYTVPEVADLLKTNENYVYKLIKAKLLPCLKLGRFKIRRQAILNFLETYEGNDLTDPDNVKEIDYDKD